MYRLNELQRNVLITVDEVVRQAPTKQTIDAKMIQNAVIIAEERFIRVALGDDYYDALLEEKNLVITSGNMVAQQSNIDAAFLNRNDKPKALVVDDVVNAVEYMSNESKALWNQFLWKLTAECVMLVAMSDAYVQFTGAGVIHNNPVLTPLGGGGEVTPDLRSIKWVMDKKMNDRIDPLMESMHQWICRQKDSDSTKYSLYTKHCNCNHKGIAYKRKTDIVLGIYPDHRRDYFDRRDPNIHPDCDCDDF